MTEEKRLLLQFLQRRLKEAEKDAEELDDSETVEDAYLQQHSYGQAEALRAVIEFVRSSRMK